VKRLHRTALYTRRRSTVGVAHSQLPAPWYGTTCRLTSQTAAPSLAVFRQRLKTFLFSRS